MITVKIKNNRNKEIEAESIDDAMYKLAEEKREDKKDKMANFLEYVKKNRITVDKYVSTTRDERNER
ncbi:MAG: hypothetical protein JSS63_12035 [Bacteroidetes bacterium]|nr:hypothetical protein [Bacteroidota bacterium]MBX7045103.1 hypothetical protein [Ignavibacteria bacterium]